MPIAGTVERSTIIIETFVRFAATQASSGVLLIACTLAAMIWANSEWGETYFHLWETHFTIGLGGYMLSKPLHIWINDGLMAMFFFTVGLEIKREVMVGELSDIRKAALPIFAAVGGMAAPALFYLVFNGGTDAAQGWGVPTATDIAFSLGVLAILGSRIPLSVKVFLAALAIADDLGAVVVITLFYSSDISVTNLGLGALVLAVMLTGNIAGVRNTWFYALLGIGGLWLTFLLSGVHATIAGVLGALAIPTATATRPEQYGNRIKRLMETFGPLHEENAHMLSAKQMEIVATVKAATTEVEAPLQALEHRLHPWVTYLVMPVFAFANAGIIIPDDIAASLLSPLSLGIIAGLFLGKAIGIMLFSFAAQRLRIGTLPEDMSWAQLTGIGFIAGIGFTMSIFISGLAFGDPEHLAVAKLAIMVASLLSGVTGCLILYRYSASKSSK